MSEYGQNEDKPVACAELFRQMLDAMPVPVALIGRDGRVLYRSAEIEALFGYTAEDIQTEDDWWLLAYPDEQYREQAKRAWHEEMERAIREREKPRVQEWVVTCKDGSQKYIEFNAAIVNGNCLIVFNDITDRKQQDARLMESEARFKTLAEASFEGIVISSEGVIVDVNDQFIEMSGYARKELIGTPVIDMVAPESKDIVAEAMRTQRLDPYMNVLLRKDRKRLVIETRARSVQIGDSLVRISALRDITEREQVEEALRFTQYVMDNTSDIAYWVAPDGQLIYANNAATELMGYTREEFLNMNILDISPTRTPEDWSAHWRELRDKKKLTFETRHRAKSGRDILVEVTANMVEFEGKEYNCAFIRDITEHKKTEEELRLTQYVVENMLDGAQWVRKDASFFYVNKASCDELGYTKEELLQMLVYDVDVTFTEPLWEQSWEELRRRKTRTIESVHIAKDGHLIPVEITASLLEYGGAEFLCALIRDITERKEAESSLRLSQNIIETMSDMAFWITPDARFIYANQAAIDLLGYTRDELLNMAVPDVNPNFPMDAWDADWAETREKKWRTVEGVNKTKDGRLIPVDIRINFIQFEGKEYNCTITRDITERKRAENALKESEERLRLATSAANQGIFDLDLRTGVGKTSPEHAIMLGCDPTDFHETYQMWLERIHPDDRKRVDDAFSAYVHGEISEYEVESRQSTRSGEWKWILSTGKIIEWDSELNPIRMVGINTDITERKTAEIELLRTNKSLRAIIDSSPLSIVVFDPERNVASWNPAAEEIYGWMEDEVIGRAAPYVPENGAADYAELWRKVLSGEGFINEQVSRIKKDGTLIDVDVSAYTVKDERTGVLSVISISTDITERKHAEEALKLTQFTVDHAADGIVWIDPDGRFRYANNTTLHDLGYTSEELLSMSIFDIDLEITPDEWSAQWQHISQQGPVIFESTHKAKDGHTYPVEIVANYLEFGGMQYDCAFARDITERKRAEGALLQEKALTDAIFNAVPGTLYVLDEQGYFERHNTRLEEVIGLPADKLSVMSALDMFWTGDSKSKVQAAIKQTFSGERTETEASWLTKESGERIFLLTGERLIIENKNYVVGIGIDITERKRSEEDLALTNEELRVINRLISETAGVSDLKSILDMAAEEALKIVGLEGSTVCLIRPDDVFELAAHRATSVETLAELEHGVIKVGECLCGMCAKTGMPLILSTKQEVLNYATREVLRGEDIKFHAAFPLMAESGCLGVLCVFTRTDKKPTERSLKLLETATKQIAIAIERARLFEEVKRNAEELEQRVSERTTQLENANKEMEAFSYSVSHDLRAPLRAIDGFSLVMLEDYSDQINEEGKLYLNRIRAAAVRMGNLIDDILRLSRITRAEMVSAKVDLSEIVRLIASDLMESQPERKVDFIIEPRLIVDGDANLLKVVLENMVGNAWKFTSKKDAARIEFGVIEEKGKKIYFVRDNGAGFDQKYADKLFVAFQRLHSDAEFPGTGIGLATVKRIVHRHGGEVWATGELDKGATFYFTLEGRR